MCFPHIVRCCSTSIHLLSENAALVPVSLKPPPWKTGLLWLVKLSQAIAGTAHHQLCLWFCHDDYIAVMSQRYGSSDGCLKTVSEHRLGAFLCGSSVLILSQYSYSTLSFCFGQWRNCIYRLRRTFRCIHRGRNTGRRSVWDPSCKSLRSDRGWACRERLRMQAKKDHCPMSSAKEKTY